MGQKSVRDWLAQRAEANTGSPSGKTEVLRLRTTAWLTRGGTHGPAASRGRPTAAQE